MGATRLKVQIDLLDLGRQVALPLTTLTPPELIAAILQEFREVDTLGLDSGEYCLQGAVDGRELDPNAELGAQLGAEPQLRLVERQRATPPGAQAVADGLYLREEAGGRVYRLRWLPAIIGRHDPAVGSNQLVAVDLEKLPTGLRVSRRHVRITQEEGRYAVESMSSNSASLRRVRGGTLAITRSKQPLEAGDIIVLNRSEIALRFIVRPQTPVGGEAGGDAGGKDGREAGKDAGSEDSSVAV